MALSRSNAIAVIDCEKREVKTTIDVGNAPFSIVSVAGKVIVTNRGGQRAKAGDATAPSSGTSIVTDPLTGATTSGTVSIVNLETRAVHDVAIGLAPAAAVLSPDAKTLAIANSNSDSVTLLDTASLRTTVVPIPTYPESAIGSQPIGLRYSLDGKTLYVACGGNNAIAVISNGKVQGAIPAGWFPSALLVDSKGALRILNIKGVGSTANTKGTFNSREYQGSLLKLPVPTAAQISAGTEEVRAANAPSYEPAQGGGVKNLSSLGIEHVLFIVKENRTYDQVLGDIGKGNSDPKLSMYPREVSPNHHALAEQYVLLDNFYTGGAISFDGHQWLMQAFVSDYVERAFSASPRGYAWNMADALTVSPIGFFWQGGSKPLGVRIYGEFCVPGKWNPTTQNAMDMNEDEELTWTQYYEHWKKGTWPSAVGCQAGVPAMKPFMDPRAPHDSMAINDQIRVEEFLREYNEFEAAGKVPNLSVLLLNSDHTEGKRPGYPTPRAMVADNDLALGRIVEAVSKSKSWAKTLILVVEDDAQDGVDHVDGHRTVALAIGPHIKRGVVDSNNYNHTSMVRTMQEIFNIPSRTRFVKAARAMNSMFQVKPDLTPYKLMTPSIALDEMNPPLKALSGKQLWAAQQSIQMDFDHIDRADKDVLNRILWWEAKGYDKPYPTR